MSAFLYHGKVIHYESLGRGKPVLFLHGWLGSWRYWMPSMQAASISYRAYALDLIGYGESARAEEDYSLEGQTALVDGFLEQMGIARVALIGHGLGAVVALRFAVMYPQYVDRVMTVGFPFEVGSLHPRLKSAGLSDLVDWLAPKEPEYDAVRGDAAKGDAAALKTSLENLEDGELAALWQHPGRVSLFVHGLQDAAVSPPREDMLNRLPLLAHAIGFETAGHFPMLDQSIRFHRLMVDFLTLESGESPRDLQVKDEWKRRVR